MTQTVRRAKPTPKNPFGVAVGQIWMQTDRRRSDNELIEVQKINLRTGYATVASCGKHGGLTGLWSINQRRIKLTRFSPKHHYRLYH